MPPIEQPNNANVADLNLTELDAFYVCPAGETLDTNDLLPVTTGDMQIAPETQTSRVQLHNGSDLVLTQGEQSGNATIPAYLPDSHPKLQEIKTARKAKARIKFNAFYRDGSGLKGWCLPTSIQTASVPNDFVKNIAFEFFGVEEIDAP